jgi:hypothetical protein
MTAQFSSQKHQNMFYHFELEDKDKSFASEENVKFMDFQEN